jgi:hypothetical protein
VPNVGFSRRERAARSGRLQPVLGRATTGPHRTTTPRSLCDQNEPGPAQGLACKPAMTARRPCPTGHTRNQRPLRHTPTALAISGNRPTTGRRLSRPQPFESALLSRPRIALPVTVTVTVMLGLSNTYATDHLRITGRSRCA